MNETKLSRVILFVNDIGNMTEFYTDVLGLSVADDSDPGFIVLGAGGAEFCLHQIPKRFLSSNTDPNEDSATKVVFYSADVEGERTRLLEKNVRMKKTVVWGEIAFCDGFDPEGNIFQISSR
ncbi:MAG: VOC family protein [Acidobacteria bacterium]|nr:VOC family protein [Acidobacteriota bacterium]